MFWTYTDNSGKYKRSRCKSCKQVINYKPLDNCLEPQHKISHKRYMDYMYEYRRREERKAYQRKYARENRDKIRPTERRYRENHRNKIKKMNFIWRLRNTYGLSLEDFERKLKEQDNKCALCKKPFTSTPSIDHNHKTGEFRGLLHRSM